METKEKNIFKGDLTAKPGAVYEYSEITGGLYARGADTKTAFPKLTSVGGGLDARGDFSNVKQNDAEAPNKCRAALLSAFAAAGFSFADGILARIVSQRGRVARVVVCGKTETSYLVTNGEAWSHGDTLANAREGLLYKVGSRDTSEYKTWTMDRKCTKAEAVVAYRVITGACEQGVRSWMEQHKTPETITVRGIIEITKGSYGSETFKKFFAEAK